MNAFQAYHEIAKALAAALGRQLKPGEVVIAKVGASFAPLKWPSWLDPQPTPEEITIKMAGGIVPPILTRVQLRVQLLADGKITSADDDAVERAIANAIPSEAQRDGVALRPATIIRFRDSPEFHRTHRDVISLASVLGYNTSEKLDAFFIAGGAR